MRGNESTFDKAIKNAEDILLLLGLGCLIFLPIVFSRITYEHAYLKTFLFQTSAVLLFLSYLTSRFRNNALPLFTDSKIRYLLLFLYLWLGWNAASTIWAPRKDLVLERCGELILMLFLLVGTVHVFQKDKVKKWFLGLMAVTLSFAGLYSTWLYSQPYEQNLATVFSNRELAANFYYLPLGIIFSLGLAGLKKFSLWNQLIYFGMIIIFGGLIVGTQSSAAQICLILILSGTLFSSEKRRLLWFITPCFFVILAVIAWRTDFYTFREFLRPSESSSIGVRLDYWQSALKMFESVPFTGVGSGGFVAAIASFRSPESFGHLLATPALHHAHCFSLEVLTELGPIGLALFVFYAIVLLIQVNKNIHQITSYDYEINRGLFWGLFALLVHSCVGVGFSYTEVQGMFWLGAGLGLSHSNLPKKTTSSSSLTSFINSKLIRILTGVFALCIWWKFSLHPLQSQIWLSQGIHQKIIAKNINQSPESRRLAINQAIKNFEIVLSFDSAGRARIPANLHLATAWDLKGAVFAKNRDEQKRSWENALKSQQQFLETYPDYGLVNRNIANLAYKLNKFDLLLSAIEKQIRLNPFDLTNYRIWEWGIRQIGKKESYKKILSSINIALIHQPENEELIRLKSMIFQETKLEKVSETRDGSIPDHNR